MTHIEVINSYAEDDKREKAEIRNRFDENVFCWSQAEINESWLGAVTNVIVDRLSSRQKVSDELRKITEGSDPNGDEETQEAVVQSVENKLLCNLKFFMKEMFWLPKLLSFVFNIVSVKFFKSHPPITNILILIKNEIV